jgi:hypothetical protein
LRSTFEAILLESLYPSGEDRRRAYPAAMST